MALLDQQQSVVSAFHRDFEDVHWHNPYLLKKDKCLPLGLVVDSYLSCCFKCYKVKCRPVIVKKLSQCAGWIEKKCSGCCILPNRNSNILFQEDCIKTYCCFAAFIVTITIMIGDGISERCTPG